MRAILGIAGVIAAAGVIWYVSSFKNDGVPAPTLSPIVSPVASPIRSDAPSVKPAPSMTATTTPKPTSAPSATVSAGSFTMAQVAAHSSRASCYSVINGSVYDLTSYIDRHPGGPQRILGICGKDGSALFGDQHAGQPKPENLLASFKIGVLAQ